MGLHFDDGVTPLSSHLINQILNLWLHHSYQLLAWFMIRIVVNFFKRRKIMHDVVFFLSTLHAGLVSLEASPSTPSTSGASLFILSHRIFITALTSKVCLQERKRYSFVITNAFDSVADLPWKFQDSSLSTDKTKLNLINILKQCVLSERKESKFVMGLKVVWTLVTHNLLTSYSSSHLFVDNLELDEQHLFGF